MASITVGNEENYTCARFWKCALQVNPHSYGPQYQGTSKIHGMNAETYAQELLTACRANQVQVVGLADHGNVATTQHVRKYLTDAGVVVFPGFEVATTEKVHWVCLFSEDTTAQQLERYLGRLGLTDPADGIRPSNLGGHEFLVNVNELGGFCYAAHVTMHSGLLRGKFNNLWKDSCLQAAQIPGSTECLPPQYKQIILNQNADYQRKTRIALINAKDISAPEDLQHTGASTFIKMTRPCFASFLMAFKDPQSRVRLSHMMEKKHYSKIENISIEGGYFDGLSVELSSHLNSIIGGRGTGKSTLLECIRYALDVSHKSAEASRQGEQIVKENLGRHGGRVSLKLRSSANHMKLYTVIRRHGEPPRVFDEHENESRLRPGADLLPGIEIYGQNEIHELAKSPEALTRVLDRFVPESAKQESQLDEVYRNLRKNGDQLTNAMEQKDNCERKLAQLPRLEEQVTFFKAQGLEEKLRQVSFLEKERQLGPQILEEIRRVHEGKQALEDSLPDLVFLSEKVLERLPHADLLRRGRRILETMDATLRQKLDESVEVVGEAEATIETIVEELTGAMQAVECRLEKDFKEIPAVGGKDGKEIGHGYQLLLREIERVRPTQTRLKNIDALITELEQFRRNLLGDISDLRNARTAAKQEIIRELNKRLIGKLRLTLIPNGLRQPLRDFLHGLPGVSERKTEWVKDAQDLTILGLVDAIREGQNILLEKSWGLTSGLAEALARMTLRQIHELEEIDLQDQVILDLNIGHVSEQYKPLNQLSTGQKCTAILHLLLLNNPDPLIIDQPEDNLDNAFIAERIVQELRSAKTERQFLFATHNANIPVFGDAEWIGVCTASGDRARMPEDAQGSIDIPIIRDEVTSILEGGKEAFIQRKSKYGID